MLCLLCGLFLVFRFFLLFLSSFSFFLLASTQTHCLIYSFEGGKESLFHSLLCLGVVVWDTRTGDSEGEPRQWRNSGEVGGGGKLCSFLVEVKSCHGRGKKKMKGKKKGCFYVVPAMWAFFLFFAFSYFFTFLF